MNSQQWIEKSDKYIMKTYGRYPIVPVRGVGCRLWDADGKEYLDFLAGVAIATPRWWRLYRNRRQS
jgi:acetylornithine aminotransferase